MPTKKKIKIISIKHSGFVKITDVQKRRRKNTFLRIIRYLVSWVFGRGGTHI